MHAKATFKKKLKSEPYISECLSSNTKAENGYSHLRNKYAAIKFGKMSMIKDHIRDAIIDKIRH